MALVPSLLAERFCPCEWKMKVKPFLTIWLGLKYQTEYLVKEQVIGNMQN